MPRFFLVRAARDRQHLRRAPLLGLCAMQSPGRFHNRTFPDPVADAGSSALAPQRSGCCFRFPLALYLGCQGIVTEILELVKGLARPYHANRPEPMVKQSGFRARVDQAAAKARSTASGSFSITISRTRPATSSFLFCSQPSSVRAGTPKRRSNSLGLLATFLRISLTRAGVMGS